MEGRNGIEWIDWVHNNMGYNFFNINNFINYLLLFRRLNYFSYWSDNGEPSQHWISGYFYSKAFLTSIL